MSTGIVSNENKSVSSDKHDTARAVPNTCTSPYPPQSMMITPEVSRVGWLFLATPRVFQ